MEKTQNIDTVKSTVYLALIVIFIYTTPIDDNNFFMKMILMGVGVFFFVIAPALVLTFAYTFIRKQFLKKDEASFGDQIHEVWLWAPGLTIVGLSLGRILGSPGLISLILFATTLLAISTLTLVTLRKPHVKSHALIVLSLCMLATNSVLPKGSLVYDGETYAYAPETKLIFPFTGKTGKPKLDGRLELNTRHENWDIEITYSIPEITAVTAEEWQALESLVSARGLKLDPDGDPKADIGRLLDERFPHVEIDISVTFTKIITKTW